jgi:hypothetical protein
MSINCFLLRQENTKAKKFPFNLPFMKKKNKQPKAKGVSVNQLVIIFTQKSILIYQL